jgi:hypothetical protein
LFEKVKGLKFCVNEGTFGCAALVRVRLSFFLLVLLLLLLLLIVLVLVLVLRPARCRGGCVSR